MKIKVLFVGWAKAGFLAVPTAAFEGGHGQKTAFAHPTYLQILYAVIPHKNCVMTTQFSWVSKDILPCARP